MSGLLKFITCGSVDDGKSTLIGHILYDSKLLYADQEKALLLDSKVGSREGEVDYSLLLDGLMAEREQGITIDVAYRYFTTERRSFIVADTPGHEEYTRNMAVGASFAQLAVILTDATQGILVQTKRHARICSLMGIKHFVFAVNKMDLAGYSQKVFKKIKKDIKKLQDSLGLENVKIIPVSATEGDNVTKKSKNMAWYTDETLLSYLENVDVAGEETKEFYMPVQRVCRPSHEFRGFQGQVESGSITIGQSVKLLPSNETAKVKAILVGDKEADRAVLGQAVTIQLDREADVSRGCVLTSSDSIQTAKNITATILWMDNEKLSTYKEYLVKLGTRKVSGIIKSINYKIDINSGEKLQAGFIEKNEIAVCNIEFTEKIVTDEFKKNKTLGELILIDRVSHMTSACGVVESISSDEKMPYFEKGAIHADGYIFEEFYFNLENAFLSKHDNTKHTYHVGDKVPVKGESFKYPDYFDIFAVDSGVAVLVRDSQIHDILYLNEYKYTGLPVVDEGGFALNIWSIDDFKDFLYELKNLKDENRSTFHNKWFRFERYRRIIFTDNFWMI